MKTYCAFGLTILSDLEIPEFFPVDPDGSAHVIITQEEIPAFEGYFFWQTETKLLFQISDVGKFVIDNGCRIGYQKAHDGVHDDAI